jgi:hypothetical protein
MGKHHSCCLHDRAKNLICPLQTYDIIRHHFFQISTTQLVAVAAAAAAVAAMVMQREAVRCSLHRCVCYTMMTATAAAAAAAATTTTAARRRQRREGRGKHHHRRPPGAPDPAPAPLFISHYRLQDIRFHRSRVRFQHRVVRSGPRSMPDSELLLHRPLHACCRHWSRTCRTSHRTRMKTVSTS